MSIVQEMLRSSPTQSEYPDADLAACIEACLECAAACAACADACLGEEMVADLRSCITVDLGCADMCVATSAVLCRQTEPDAELIRAALLACRDACRVCAQECERHAGAHEHCRVCADACRRCENACEGLLTA